MMGLLALGAKLNIFAAAPCASHTFFFLPTWYEYLNTSTDSINHCTIAFQPPGDIWKIGLAVIDILLHIAGLVAVGSIMYAGAEYLFTQGNAEKGISARKRIVNSIIGLAIAVLAIAVVSFIGDSLK
ncbi:MAG TPA: hypothetical protein VMT23_00345 [Candidatus Binatia bacterium]|nr:hypothetical protein [Candidatus Binatia bacterium]